MASSSLHYFLADMAETWHLTQLNFQISACHKTSHSLGWGIPLSRPSSHSQETFQGNLLQQQSHWTQRLNHRQRLYIHHFCYPALLSLPLNLHQLSPKEVGKFRGKSEPHLPPLQCWQSPLTGIMQMGQVRSYDHHTPRESNDLLWHTGNTGSTRIFLPPIGVLSADRWLGQRLPMPGLSIYLPCHDQHHLSPATKHYIKTVIFSSKWPVKLKSKMQ